MNNKQVTFSIFFLSIFLLAALRMNGAETNENISPTTWSYQECLNYAIEHNIDLRRELLTSESSKVDLEKAKAQWLPSLNFARHKALQIILKIMGTPIQELMDLTLLGLSMMVIVGIII